MIIGLDIDDVIYRTSEAVKTALAGFGGFDISMQMDIMRGDVRIPAVKKFWEENLVTLIREYDLMEGAAEGIGRLKDRHKIILITARGNKCYPGAEEVTREILAKDGIVYDSIVYNSLDKARDCEKNEIELFIDDSPKNCLEVAKKLRIPVVGFASGVTKRELDRNGVFNVDNWGDLERVVSEIVSGKSVVEIGL